VSVWLERSSMQCPLLPSSRSLSLVSRLARNSGGIPYSNNSIRRYNASSNLSLSFTGEASFFQGTQQAGIEHCQITRSTEACSWWNGVVLKKEQAYLTNACCKQRDEEPRESSTSPHAALKTGRTRPKPRGFALCYVPKPKT
jgi:hypothetical protein